MCVRVFLCMEGAVGVAVCMWGVGASECVCARVYETYRVMLQVLSPAAAMARTPRAGQRAMPAPGGHPTVMPWMAPPRAKLGASS
jgi:hypothetical protein